MSVEITIDNFHVGDIGVPLTEDQERMLQLIWKSNLLLHEKGTALLHAARGDVCKIDVGGANLIAHRVRPVSLKCRESLAYLIKG